MHLTCPLYVNTTISDILTQKQSNLINTQIILIESQLSVFSQTPKSSIFFVRIVQRIGGGQLG